MSPVVLQYPWGLFPHVPSMQPHKCSCPAPATASQGVVPTCPLHGRPQTSHVLLQYPRGLSPHVLCMPAHKSPLPCSCSSIQGMIPTCPLHGTNKNQVHTHPVLLLPADPCHCPLHPAVGQAGDVGGTLAQWDPLPCPHPHLALPSRSFPWCAAGICSWLEGRAGAASARPCLEHRPINPLVFPE